MVTAELAVALPVVVVVLVVVLGALSVGIDRVRCVDAARIGARALARGESAGRVVTTANRAAPPGARVSPVVGGAQVSVTVGLRRTIPLLGWGLDVSATAVADRERVDDGAAGGGP